MSDDRDVEASSHYPLGQLWRAVATARAHPNREVRKRAEHKAERWAQVLSGMASGELAVGTRTPVAATPAWVTLEVAHGGFATGRYLAELPLDEDEAALLRTLPSRSPGTTDRERLNLWFLSDPGLAILLAALPGERYRVEVPEEGALLVVAGLVDRGHHELALDLVAELRPLMHRLRFTPRLRSHPRPSGAFVHLQTVAEVAAPLRSATVEPQIAAMFDTLGVWNPLFDRLVTLWADTVDGELPTLVAGRVEGGWPAQVWNAEWEGQRVRWFSDFRVAAAEHPLTGRHHQPRSNFTRLRQALERANDRGTALTAREVGWVRRALANTISKHGAPGTEPRAALRATQAGVASRPTYAQIAHIVAGRLDRYPDRGAIPALEPLAAAVASDETASGPAVGAAIPKHIVRKVARALEAPIDELVDRGVIGSSETLARVLPQITSEVLAANISDPTLAAVYAQVYAAFRRRRSLLLLNLEHQVRIDELPWIAALSGFRAGGAAAQRGATQTLRQATLLALTAFPQTVLPNPLVREFAALAKEAELQVPLVDEVAADIFMGTFTAKWRTAAAITSAEMAGTLYARYYDLPAPQMWADAAPSRAPRWVTRRWGKETADDFAALCAARAKEAQVAGQEDFVAVNGTVLEQSQILTTQNLAALMLALGIRDQLSDLAPDLADGTLGWIGKRQAQPWRDYLPTMQMIKNTAYAWRQAIFFLSLCDPGVQRDVVARFRGQLPSGGPGSGLRLAVDGLDHVIGGGRFSDHGLLDSGPGRRFLGWSAGRHWLITAKGDTLFPR